MRVSRIARGSFYAGLATTAAFIASFLHLDAQLSHGSMSALTTEGIRTLCLAVTNVILWSIAFRARVRQNRVEAAAARKRAKQSAQRRQEQTRRQAVPGDIASVERLEAA